VQGEFVQEGLDASTGGTDADISGFYFFVSWFLTGESRNYKTSTGAFDRIKVKQPWGKEGGKGAWEIAARYSSLDLNDGTFSNDEVQDVTLGANWYINQNTRMMFNYIHSDADDGTNDGSADILAARFAVEF
jgi:phosphate-selective porin OprO/OprP